MEAGFPQVSDSRQRATKAEVAVPLYDLVSEVTHCEFCFILPVLRGESLSPADWALGGKDSRLPLLEEEYPFVDIL